MAEEKEMPLKKKEKEILASQVMGVILRQPQETDQNHVSLTPPSMSDRNHWMILSTDEPTKLKSGELHRQLLLHLKEDYDTCTTIHKQAYVKFKTPKKAQEWFRQALMLDQGIYRVENTDYSTLFVSQDVWGSTTEKILGVLKDMSFLTRHNLSLGFRRQNCNGPVAVIEFSAPPLLFSFSVKVDGRIVDFVRAKASCEVCNDTGHFIGTCDQVTKILAVSHPIKRSEEELESRREHLLRKLKGRCTTEIVQEVKKFCTDFQDSTSFWNFSSLLVAL